MEFMINEVMELLPFIGLAGIWSMNKPSPFSPFKKKPRQGGEELFKGAGPYGSTETVLGSDISTPEGQGTGIATQNVSSRVSNIIDTGNIDFGDKKQVMGIQRAIGVEPDGIWGNETEVAYQNYINERRSAQGLGQYMYDDLPVKTNDNNIGTSGTKPTGVGAYTSIAGMEPGDSQSYQYRGDTYDNFGNRVDAQGNPTGDTTKEESEEAENKFWGPDKLWDLMGYE